jgi:regulatory protein
MVMAHDAMTIRERALGLLARREYTARELGLKLAPHAADEEELAALLDDFTRRGWLSEQRFTEQVVHARQGRFGVRRIVHELKEKGVGADAVAAILPELRETELESARTVWAKKFGSLPQDARERAKQMSFLASRGFGAETITKVLRRQEDD